MLTKFVYDAHVMNVVDGDTFDVTIDLGMNVFHKTRIRLNGFDAPEIYGVKKDSDEYALGVLAKQFAITQLLGKNVVIRTFKDRREKFGRYLADVYIRLEDGTFINFVDKLTKELESKLNQPSDQQG
jgi:micrococcal nuclease